MAVAGTFACGGGSAATGASTNTPTLTSCAAWAATQRGSGVAAANGLTAAQRQALLAAGGGLKAVANRYYVMWFPSSWASSARRRVLVSLHGTGGAPEAEWNGWRQHLEPRGWAFVGLLYLDVATGSYDDDTTIYTNLKTALGELGTSCDASGASYYLAGFSRGSAMGFPVTYRDGRDRQLFKATLSNAGAWLLNEGLYPTLAGIEQRGERSAFTGSRFWMYCGEQDFEHGYPMCDEMENARSWVASYGAQVDRLYRNPGGDHGSMVHTADAIQALLDYFESLP